MITFEFLIDPNNSASGSKYYQNFAIFKHGYPE
jgi:hypothetical protein